MKYTNKFVNKSVTLLLAMVIILNVFPLSAFANDLSNTYQADALKDSNEIKSERRIKYEQLLEGNYYAGELLIKFHELFGCAYTTEYIKENYTEIFDISANEIDEGFLELLTLSDHSSQNYLTSQNGLQSFNAESI